MMSIGGQWQFSAGIAGNFHPEWVAIFAGISGRVEPEYASNFACDKITPNTLG